MKKILALAVAGTLMMTSSVCVFATEGIGITEGNADTNTSGGKYCNSKQTDGGFTGAA